MKIVISSGKGGTGKTFIATNIARVLDESGYPVRYLDCDVEEPNGHLFLKPDIVKEETVSLLSPTGVDENRCIACGRCVEVCHYNAIAMIKEKVLFFKNLCHVCGACTLVCPVDAVIEEDRRIGVVKHGKSGTIDFHYALLETAEGGMSPRLIRKVKQCTGKGIHILDSPPGTACPVVETVKDADLCVLVTDPTPFGIHDLKLAVNMCRQIGREPVVLVNRAEYHNEDLRDYCRGESLEIVAEIPDDRKIAECYSVGDLAVDRFPEYRALFTDIAGKIVSMARKGGQPARKSVTVEHSADPVLIGENSNQPLESRRAEKTHEYVIISGKGGTGKTSLAAAFCALEKRIAIADCDVDAADLHLLLQPEIKKRGVFSGSDTAVIDPDRCTGCGECERQCRFDAILQTEYSGRKVFKVDEIACEGCGVCGLACPEGAVICSPAWNGEWFVSDTRFGPMSHARLGPAEENSGKLVTLVRQKKDEAAFEAGLNEAVVDGSPGTGCPVIASLSGAEYAVVVTEPTVSGVHDLRRILDVVRFFRVPAGIVVNKWDLNKEKTEEIHAIAGEYEAEFLGRIPYDKVITLAQVKGVSVVEYSDGPVTQAVREVWGKIVRRKS
ncbi:MAG TPA: 4Fe-4S dicluster domain-containing protein [bacterium]|nr:4Fe-4S dicluster domain-containing protein [bacterium]